ncbi:hypothetical protein [Phocaeicola abscessus]|uniref:hypothetical protein n=1 Tax=Phocaeicola abscessus TaxID=555313 RepID=UPI0028EE98C0|nr:hypothetical protein [Phocaeicola abscessus]
MKKEIKQIGSAMTLLAVLAAGCTEDMNVPEAEVPTGKNKITITVLPPSAATTRVIYDDSQAGISGGKALSWEEGDELLLTGFDAGNNYLGNTRFTYKGADNKFEGELVPGAVKYGVHHPSNMTLDNNGIPTYPESAQTQTADDNAEHLRKFIILHGETSDIGRTPIALEMASSILKFRLTNVPAEVGTLQKLVWTVQAGSTDYSSAALAFLSGAVTFSDSKRDLTAYLSFYPGEFGVLPGGTFSVVLMGDKTYKAETSIAGGKSYNRGKRYTAAIDGTPATMEWTKMLSAPFRFGIRTNTSNEVYTIGFLAVESCPAALTVDWGDGTAATLIPAGTSTNSELFKHTYAAAGIHTIVVVSEESTPTQLQLPRLKFTSDTKLVSVETPFLNMGATNFNNYFSGCTSLQSIPDKLFENNTKATDFNRCFSGCRSLQSIPDKLFESNTKATSFANCFANCSSLSAIPAILFAQNTVAKDFLNCFIGCTSLTTIPAGLFEKNTEATRFVHCFSGCTSLQSIPDKLFENNTKATDFNNCFYGCKSLTSIPARLFETNTKATKFNGCFNGCSSLQTIPAGLFDHNTEVMDFSNCFTSCQALTTAPDNLFAYNTKATNFIGCFYFCRKLKLNDGIFCSPENLACFKDRTMNFKSCFYGVGSALSESERGTAPRLWEYDKGTATWTIQSCFTNAKVTNGNDIPAAWK